MSLQTLLRAVTDANGSPRVTTPDTYTMEALRRLAEAVGLSSMDASDARAVELVSIYHTALKGEAGARLCAAKVALTIAAREGRATTVTLPASPTHLPASVDLGPIMAQMEAMRDELDALRAATPTVVQFKGVDPLAAPVTIAGAHPKLAKIVGWLKSGDNVYCYGPAGSGKTHLATQCAEALDVPFYASSCVSSITDLIGFKSLATGEYVRTPWRDAFEHGGMMLLDELDGGENDALTPMNMALDNGFYAFPDGVMVTRHANCYVMGTANTVGHGPTAEYVGRNKLDGAFLDRFAQIELEYDLELEKRIAPLLDWTLHVQRIRQICQEEGIKAIISPRASIRGGKAIASGLVSWEEAEEARVYRGMSETEVNTIRARLA